MTTLQEVERLAIRAGMVAVGRDDGRILFTRAGDAASTIAVWFPADGRFLDANAPSRVGQADDAATATRMAAELAAKKSKARS